MFSSGDSDVYVPSEAGVSMTVFHTPPQTPRKAPRMVMEVVIPTRKSTKQYSPSPVERTEPATLRSGRTRVREPSPARSDSSISLGSYVYRSPQKKRIRRRKRPSTAAEEKRARPLKRRNRKCDQRRAATETSQHEHTTVSVPPLAAPITADLKSYPRSPSISPFKSRAPLPSTVPGLKININLESARLETIQAQESARGYDIYHYWPTPPGSGSTKARVGNALNTPTAPCSPGPRAPLYASPEAGSSTGPGTQEHDKLYEEPRWTPWESVSAPQNLGVPSNLTLFSPLTTDRSHPSFAETVEAELCTASPEVNKLARLGLQTALAELVDRYDYPLEGVSKLYRSKGCLEETERVLRQLRSTADDLRAMTNAAFGVE